MLVVFLLFVVASAKENFQITANGISFSLAFNACFNTTSPVTNKTYCDAGKGCCNGHGVCVVNSTLIPSCVCGQPIECRPGLTTKPYYSGVQCQTWPTNCCTSGSDDLPFSTYGGCHLNSSALGLVDPELGAKGNLLKRLGCAQYANFRGYYNDSDFTAMVNALTNSSRPIQMMNALGNQTSGNMMGLGFLEVAVKDIVHYMYNTSQNVSIPDENGTIWQYPALQWQNNTGLSNISKQFENTASAVIDLGPLYDYATPNGSYLNGAPAVSYWNSTHHVSKEFTVALRLYWRYHNYVARGLEEYFWASNSWTGTINNANPSINFNSSWVFEQAKRSTKRFSQAVVEQAALHILLDSPSTDIASLISYWQPTFDAWIYRDGDQPYGFGWFGNPKPTVRDNQEFNRGFNRSNFATYLVNEPTHNYMSHYMIAGLDFFLSLRNPNFNYTYANPLKSWDTSGCGSWSSNDYDGLAYDILALQATPLQRFGSRINSVYTKDLKLQLYRARELGLDTYAAHVGQLTHAPGSAYPPGVSDLTSTQQNADVFYQSHLESNSTRQYRFALASVVFATGMAINDMLITDRTGYWARDANGNWVAGIYHPDPNYFDPLPVYQYLNCFPGDDPDGDDPDSGCDPASVNVAPSILGYSNDMKDWWTCCELDTDPFYERSQGSLFSYPPNLYSLGYQPTDPTSGWPDFTMRTQSIFGVLDEMLNALYYQYDGLKSLAVKQGTGSNYLPTALVDAFASNIAWNHYTWDIDWTCYTSAFLDSPCVKPPSAIDPTFCDSSQPNYMPTYYDQFCTPIYNCYWAPPLN